MYAQYLVIIHNGTIEYKYYPLVTVLNSAMQCIFKSE